MAREHSFTITLSNNLTEKAGLQRLFEEEPEWVVPDRASRLKILEVLGLPRTYSRAFDLVWIKGRPRDASAASLTAAPKDIILIELKTTRKRLPASPRGFFFGATHNEIELAQKLGDAFRFCFVCLHPETPSHKLLTLAELEAMTKTKRVQYQINLR